MIGGKAEPQCACNKLFNPKNFNQIVNRAAQTDLEPVASVIFLLQPFEYVGLRVYQSAWWLNIIILCPLIPWVSQACCTLSCTGGRKA